MAWPTPEYTRSEVNRAGDTLRSARPSLADLSRATGVLGNWRSCHGFPINTFQATLRSKLARIGQSEAIVAQRLKRFPSIIAKLRRFDGMQLARMQDIGGLRTVVSSLTEVRRLESDYRSSRFNHELINHKDYIANPKSSGYRSVHLVYRNRNPRTSEYDGLLVEIQIRSRDQHTWATAVETMGTFLGQALKSSEGQEEWLAFFSLAGAAFAHMEGTPPVPGFEHLSKRGAYEQTLAEASRLRIRESLSGFTVAMSAISDDRRPGSYRLIRLDLEKRQVSVATYAKAELQAASQAYSEIEAEISAGANLQAVLVATGPIETLRRAYPNYFLDTRDFIDRLNQMQALASRRS